MRVNGILHRDVSCVTQHDSLINCYLTIPFQYWNLELCVSPKRYSFSFVCQCEHGRRVAKQRMHSQARVNSALQAKYRGLSERLALGSGEERKIYSLRDPVVVPSGHHSLHCNSRRICLRPIIIVPYHHAHERIASDHSWTGECGESGRATPWLRVRSTQYVQSYQSESIANANRPLFFALLHFCRSGPL